MSGPPSNTVSASRYLHLAPAYALQPPTASPSSSSSPSAPPPATKSRTSPSNELRPYAQDEVRQLVLDYLCHSGYLDSAKAFARELSEADDSASEGKQDGETGGTRANGATEGARRNGDAMEGVEATPPPPGFGDEASSAAGVEALKELARRERAPSSGNGKTVAFTEEDGSLEESDEACGSLSEEDVRDVRLRRNIREAILSGRINHATELLKEHYPSVLLSSSSTTPSAALPPFLTPHSSSKTSPCTPHSFFVTSPPSSAAYPPSSGTSTPSTSPSYIPITGSTFGSWALSLSPEIISLNLQTQAFIEHMRAAHASSAMSAPSTPTSSVHNGHTPRHHASNGDDVGSDAGMSASTSSLTSSSLLNVAIAQSQALREKVLQLPPGKQREGWEKESIDVCGLLAYKDLSSCPVRGYLAQGRRETLAEMVNAAIMQQTNRTPLSLLALAARQTTALWTTLRDMHVQFPPKPTTSTKEKERKTARELATDDERLPAIKQTYPTFDLRTFLNERDAPPAAFGASSAIMQTE
ncbi:hypothetical protein JCM6882_006667 [Rhodosporidiobolus microsporus]